MSRNTNNIKSLVKHLTAVQASRGRRLSAVAVITTTALLGLFTSSATASSPNLGSCIANQTIYAGQYLDSGTNHYTLQMQSDGNLVLYTASGQPLWDTQTAGHPGAYAVQQGDGNFVVYSSANKALWSAALNSSGARLCMQTDGNLVIYSTANRPVWATDTSISAVVGGTVSTNPAGGSPGQCTWYAENMFNGYFLPGGYMNTYGPNNGNAMYWATNASLHGWAIGSTPRIDSMVVFQPGENGAGPVGHVAWVTEVYPASNTITITEDNYPQGNGPETRTLSPVAGVQYIYVNP
jgi:surface antigen